MRQITSKKEQKKCFCHNHHWSLSFYWSSSSPRSKWWSSSSLPMFSGLTFTPFTPRHECHLAGRASCAAFVFLPTLIQDFLFFFSPFVFSQSYDPNKCKGRITAKKKLSSFVIFRLQCFHYLLFNIQVTFFSSVIFSTSIMNITMNYKYN